MSPTQPYVPPRKDPPLLFISSGFLFISLHTAGGEADRAEDIVRILGNSCTANTEPHVPSMKSSRHCAITVIKHDVKEQVLMEASYWGKWQIEKRSRWWWHSKHAALWITLRVINEGRLASPYKLVAWTTFQHLLPLVSLLQASVQQSLHFDWSNFY